MRCYFLKNKSITMICILLLIIGFFVTHVTLTQGAEESDYAGSYQLTATNYLYYGSQPEDVGIINVPEGSAIGPTSFNIDSEGQMYVCDGVNNRIQVLSLPSLESDQAQIAINEDVEKQSRLSQIPIDIEEIYLYDIVIQKPNSVIIYDEIGKLYQLDSGGNLLKNVEVDTTSWDVKMEMHIVDHKIYMQCVAQKDHLIGIIENGSLREPTIEERVSQENIGIHGESGRRYLAGLDRWEKGWIEVFKPGDESGFTIELPVPGIVSVKFLGEDGKGNIYVQTEKVGEEGISLEGNGVTLEVHKFDSNGKSIDLLEIPDNEYHYWTVKLLSVDKAGNIYQMLPQKDGIELNLFKHLDE